MQVGAGKVVPMMVLVGGKCTGCGGDGRGKAGR